jgi:hypothetical protein
MKFEYLSFPWNTSLGDWYKKLFYIREEPNTPPFVMLATPRRRESAGMRDRSIPGR